MEFLLYLVLGGFAGVLAGLFGVGGGIIIVPVLVFSFTLQGFNSEVLTHLAVGTSLATIIFTSINSIREHHRKGAARHRKLLRNRDLPDLQERPLRPPGELSLTHVQTAALFPGGGGFLSGNVPPLLPR